MASSNFKHIDRFKKFSEANWSEFQENNRDRANFEMNLERIWNNLRGNFNEFERNLWISKEENKFITAAKLIQFKKLKAIELKTE